MSADQHTLESMCELIVDCPHSTPKWTDSGVLVLRNNNIKNGCLDLSNPSFTDEKHYQQRIKRAIPKPGDIVFTREAPMGEVCMIPAGVKCCLGQRQVLLRPKKEICGEYLLFALQSPAVQHEISWNEGTGSTVSNVRIPVLKNLNIPRHPGYEDKIAGILSSLSNKIELNRQINQTLEEMAQAIFKSWFVDFEPVKAKIEAKVGGQDPERAAMCAISGKTDAELDLLSPGQLAQLRATAALFPDELTDSELGPIPKGWEVGCMKNCCLRVESGGTPKRGESNYWDGNIRWLSSGEVRNVIILDTKEKITEEGLRKSSAKLWPYGSTVVAMYGATAGQVCLLAKEMAANQACCSLIPKKNCQNYIFLTARRSIEDLSGKASGSAQQNLNKSLVSDHRVLLPGEQTLKAFEQITGPFLEGWIRNIKQNNVLTQLRDTLLPKLLSGEISVNVAEPSIKEAV